MKAVKWVSVFIIGLIVIVIGALIVIPMFVDIQKYKPYIEKQVSAATGCPFSIGGELKLSLFPSAGLAFSDLHLGNPQGFEEKDMLAIESFEVKLKFMPLLYREIQVERFVMDGLKVALEKNKAGKRNWEFVKESSTATRPAVKKTEEKKSEEGTLAGLRIKSLAVGEVKISNAAILWIDIPTGTRREIKDLMLELKDVSFDRPIKIILSANLDGNPLRFDGVVGPLGTEWVRGDILLSIEVKAFKNLALAMNGTVRNALEQPAFDLEIDIAPFSPRKLLGILGKGSSINTSDSTVLTRMGLKANAKGDLMSVSLTDGIIELDQSKIAFLSRVKDFAKPDIAIDMSIDNIDIDRYLPPDVPKESAEGGPASSARKKNKFDYGLLRKPVINMEIRAGKIKVKGARARDVFVKVRGKDGVFTVNPFELKAYQGNVDANAVLDVRAEKPKANVNVDVANMMIRPLLNDLMKKDFLEGTTKTKLALTMEGDDFDAIKRTLNGEGNLHLTDGAIIGIDLPGMVRNVKAAFGVGKPVEKPKTDFTELVAPFTIKDGVATTSGASMASPLLRVVATGNADLVEKTLDMRVKPKVVGTLKGQQDTKERRGLMVPVLVTGTFSSPRFAPDLKGILETEIGEKLKTPEGIMDILEGGDTSKEGTSVTDREKVKEALEGLLGK